MLFLLPQEFIESKYSDFMLISIQYNSEFCVIDKSKCHLLNEIASLCEIMSIGSLE